MVEYLAHLHRPPRSTRVDRLGRNLHRRQLRSSEKRGPAVGKTKRGKDTKFMVVADGQGVPLGGYLCSASPAEVTLVDVTLACVDKNALIQRLIADKAYDSQSLRDELADQQIELIAPHRKNRKQPKTQDGRSLRRYRKQWIIERTIGWVTRFRRITTQWERQRTMYRVFFHVACLIITMRHLCNDL